MPIDEIAVPAKPRKPIHPMVDFLRRDLSPQLDSAALGDGMWRGRRCFVVGNGPSLERFDLQRLDGELSIAVNGALNWCDSAAVSFSMDTRFPALAQSGGFGQEMKKKYEDFAGLKVFLKTSESYRYPAGSYVLSCRSEGGLKHRMTTTLKDGLGHGECSGFAALNLALNLRADPIYLVGFDMRDDEKRTENRAQGLVAEYPKRRAYFEASAADALGRARVINLNPDSALQCFPFGDVADMEWPECPMFVSYYTERTGYEIEAKGLAETLVRWGLEHDVQGWPSAGSWTANCNQKADFVAQMRRKHAGRRLVWLDSDARVRRHPSLFEHLDCDFAAHFLDGEHACVGRERRPSRDGELLGGSLYFAPSWRAEALIDAWLERNREYPGEWDQANLQGALASLSGTRVARLSVEYCSIFDHPRRATEPVIEQMMASRRLRHLANRKAEEPAK